MTGIPVVLILLACIIVFILLCFKGFPPALTAPILAMVVLVTAGMDVYGGMTGAYMTGTTNFLLKYYLIFMTGAKIAQVEFENPEPMNLIAALIPSIVLLVVLNVLDIGVTIACFAGIVVAISAAMSGSPSGGLNIALENLSEHFLDLGINPGVIHRISVVASGSLDSLPSCATLINELNQALTMAENDSDVKVIVLTGEGKAFCAGGDLGTMK